ncbi:MAG: hypothetical protein CL569_19390 [Alphaproteobacteria bacterium]|nr:hypothetical protein [Alphaproteobacteria bacterium]
MFWRRVLSVADERIGGLYEYEFAGNMVEMARVISVEDDDMGIPHVRFRSVCCGGNEVADRGPRLLGLESFLNQY